MVWHIARREILEHLQSVRLVAIGVLALVLMPLGAYVNARNYEARLAYHEALASAARQAAERGGPPSGWMRGNDDEVLRALRRPSPLSVLAVGHDATMPAYWQFGLDGTSDGPPLARSEGLAGLLGEVDFLFVTQVILGLLAVLIAFDAITGEKESGTLRAVLANALPRPLVIIGKYLAGLIILFLPLLLGTLAALLVLRLTGLDLMASLSLARVVLFALAGAVYLSALLALGLAISAFTQQQRTSMVLLLVLWVALVLVVPRVATLAATALRPVEAEQVTRFKKSAAVAELDAERRKTLEAVYRRVVGEDAFAGGRITTNMPPALREAYNAERARVEAGLFRRKRELLRALDEGRERVLDRQRDLAGLLSRLSPAASFGFVATEAAGTGESTRRRWLRQVGTHQRSLEGAAFDRTFGLEIYAGRSMAMSGPGPGEPRPPRYAELPQFRYAAPPFGGTVVAAMPDIALLLGFNVLMLGVAFVGFLRYDVR